MDIPLFPLHTVLCPGIALPLHIFEPRYRLMTQRCIDDASPFGVVLIRDGQEVGGSRLTVANVGTLATIREAGRYPDGRYDLLVVGTARFAVEAVDTDREPYLVGSVIELGEEVGNEDRASMLAARSMRRFATYLRLLQPMEGESAEEIDVRVEVETSDLPEESAEPGGRGGSSAGVGDEPMIDVEVEGEGEGAESARRRVLIPDDPTTLSHLLSGIIQVELPRRQALLEAETTEERLDMIDRILDRELWLLRRRLRLFTPPGAQLPQRRS